MMIEYKQSTRDGIIIKGGIKVNKPHFKEPIQAVNVDKE
jgi:hypothetical protein